MRRDWMWIAVLTSLATGAHAGLSPVAPRCLGRAQTVVVDSDKEGDLCVASAGPSCTEGATLTPDVVKTADRCVASDAAADPRKPKCPVGMRVIETAGEDVCRLTEKPTCPPSFSLSRRKGPDVCKP